VDVSDDDVAARRQAAIPETGHAASTPPEPTRRRDTITGAKPEHGYRGLTRTLAVDAREVHINTSAVRGTPLELVRPLPLLQRHTVQDSWALNTYIACDHRCTYCITSAQGRSAPRYPATVIAARLRNELDAVDTLDRLIVGPYSDVYPSPEAELRVTRAALEVLCERDLWFKLITKGTTAVRDADLFTHPRTVIHISLSSLDEGVLARLEPGAPSADARLVALHELAGLGVRVRLQASPWIPGVTDLLAICDRVDPSIKIHTAPLRLAPYLTRSTKRLGITQAHVNEAYRQEYERVGAHPQLLWSRPPPIDGSAPHISDNMGRREIVDWNPSSTAPDPGCLPREALLDWLTNETPATSS